MKARLRSVRIAPKKANLVAGMVRGLSVSKALSSLEHTPKRAARILEKLLRSAVANAEQNEKQQADSLVVKSLIVNKGQAYHRGVPMARGRVRPMRKFLSHIEVVLGVKTEEKEEGEERKEKKEETKKTVESASKTAKKTVQTSKKKSEKSTSTKKKADTTASDSTSANPVS